MVTEAVSHTELQLDTAIQRVQLYTTKAVTRTRFLRENVIELL